MNLYRDLEEYLGKKVTKEQCQAAAFGLVWKWANKESVLDYYRQSHLYNYDLTYYQNDILGDVFYDWYRRVVGKFVSGLDLGGGIGEYTIQAIKQGCKMTFIDVDGMTLKYAKWRFEKHGVSPEIHTEEFRIEKDYDFIVAMDVLEHLENPQERIEEMAAHTEYILANPHEVQYNALYPQHISRYDLTPYFDHVAAYLWKRK